MCRKIKSAQQSGSHNSGDLAYTMFVTEVKSWELRIQRIFTQQGQSPSLVLMQEFKIRVEMLRFLKKLQE